MRGEQPLSLIATAFNLGLQAYFKPAQWECGQTLKKDCLVMPASHSTNFRQSPNRVSALQLLQEAYPNQLRIPLVASAPWVGISAGTARNWVSAGTFPVPTMKLGDLRQVDIRDLAAYLDGSAEDAGQVSARPATDPDPTPALRRPGRPRKYADVARKLGGKING